MTSRIDAAWNDPRALWAIILEDEATGNTAELGEVAEHLYTDRAEAQADSARLRAELHSVACRLGGGARPAELA